MPEKVLLVGNNVRNVAESAKKAGYVVYALTKFCDADLDIYCERVYELDEPSGRRVGELVQELAESLGAKIVLCSGYETLKVEGELLSSDPAECEKVVDKLRFYRSLEKAGIRHPEILKNCEGEKAILKPRIGGGGEEISFGSVSKEGFILQRFVEGTPCSVSLIATEREIIPIATNLILAGWREMNADGFRYAGNVTPLDITRENRVKLESTAVETVELFDLIGSVGVDFILAEEPYVLEVNPRFQGSLDSIEWSCDINLFSMHVAAFEGKISARPKPRRYAIRAIFFAESEVTVGCNLSGNPFFADVPKPGSVYEKRDPLVSILASGVSRADVMGKAVLRKEKFERLVSRCCEYS